MKLDIDKRYSLKSHLGQLISSETSAPSGLSFSPRQLARRRLYIQDLLLSPIFPTFSQHVPSIRIRGQQTCSKDHFQGVPQLLYEVALQCLFLRLEPHLLTPWFPFAITVAP